MARLLGVVVLASALALAARGTQTHSALASAYDPNQSYSYRILSKPTSSDERAIRTLGLQPEAQQLSNRLFAALVKVLGGQAPMLSFTPAIAASGGEAHLSASPGQNTVNIDPYATEGLINAAAPTHSGAVNQMPHEMAHLRQVVTSVADREGGAQAFADLVTPAAAAAAHTPYDATINFDGVYAPFVKAAQARGRDWLLGTQFGHAPVPWP
jgi:hypothetical protein